ncbi:MAG: AAA family ATPase, partial [Micrococcales bacterium]|nr:AAA family ATPase [Micrococcales bacterium]
MLSELAVSQLGVIEDARIDLAPGLTVITGETGAGKTMLLNALKALMGERTEAALVRHGADQAQVQGLWELEPTDTALARAEQAGALIDAGQLLAVRTFTSKGRSRAVLGGTSVPAGVLAEVVNSLVTIHGQSDQLRL